MICQPFINDKYFPHEGRFYCDHDFWQLHGPRCGSCSQHILGECLGALGQKWHPEHFNCDVCEKHLLGKEFVKTADRPLCKPCHRELAQKAKKTIKCAMCPKGLDDYFLVFKGQRIHPEHIPCKNCALPLSHLGREKASKWYCHSCYEQIGAMPTCAACKRAIEGRSFSALGKEWHPDHFVCTKCECPFAGDAFFEYRGVPYCKPHYKQVCGDLCYNCQEVCVDSVQSLGKQYCKLCFRCSACDMIITSSTKITDIDRKPVCFPCHDTLPAEIKKNLRRQDELAKKYMKA
ncbi:hypothetical protein SARC_13132 [Sphaeroforma arctica JP610]|uniref:LIM zinc-binding domain-containing protein n=1 Tax=Sphaeroforma arctica JP610 TaxID=667725 RepID=A0A0L0FC19_9EUKA|nr:hypothetical protein SARC_13132 [Sphaeroforma arctica JP610]KNC74317.1 hypothetical protein SARC_13132 [Sphaeroforma arctica JP610]|eukprot:XP_014148219.1 hypothetical protein SARC_13132 [Sphaeroforma arctica JP610]